MKVLTKGRAQQGWSTERRCTGGGNGGGGCNAGLLVEQADLFKTHRYDHGGGHDVFTTFKCPDYETCEDWRRVHLEEEE